MATYKTAQERNDAIVFQVFALILAITTIPACTDSIPQLSGWLKNAMFPLLFFWVHFMRNYKVRPEVIVYCLALFCGFLLHHIGGAKDEQKSGFWGELFARFFPAYILAFSLYIRKPVRILQVFMLVFYIAECALAIYERIEMVHLISYEREATMSATSAYEMTTSDVFRSTSLFFHPLHNANVVSIAMGFILCMKQMKMIFRLVLFALGVAALWGFNSRGVFLVWAVIILFRFTLYNKQWWKLLIAVTILYFGIPIFLDWLLVSGLLGRMQGFDFSDGSTATRLMAFDIFLNQRWNLEDILFGGRLIRYPGSIITLENGILLDLGYWGLIVGPLKIICEIVITYTALWRFQFRDKLIIMLATWGVAMMNNNSTSAWLLTLFSLFCASCMVEPAMQEDSRRLNEHPAIGTPSIVSQ